MKLWYQSLARQTESTPYGEMLRRVIEAACDPGTTVHLQGVAESAGIGVHYRFLEHHDIREVIYNAMKAEREGYDAFLIGNISDGGIREAREIVNIPVLGMCETSLHIACMMGANFAFVGISPKWTPRLIENVQRYGLERRLVAIEPMNTSPLDLKRCFVEPAHLKFIVEQFNGRAERLLAQGAEVVIPAGGDVIVLLADAGIFEVGGAPILNGIVELVKMGELAVKLKRHTGRFTAKRGGYAAPAANSSSASASSTGPTSTPAQGEPLHEGRRNHATMSGLAKFSRLAGCAAFFLWSVLPAPAQTQTFPSKAVRIIVPFAPGGGTDNLTRIMAPKLTEALGQSVVVDNRAGGNSQIGTELAARAAADGHTLLHVDTSFTSNPSLFSKLPYDALRDFAPVSLLASAPVVLIVHPSVPARSLKELIALARARPGELNFATGGAGSATHLGTELFKLAAGVDLVHIPYKGTGPATVAVLSGQVAIMIGSPSASKPHVAAGRLRALAVTGAGRIPALPEVPTFSELGLPGLDAGSHWVSLAPAGTPQPAIRTLSAAMAKSVQAPDVKPRLVDLGFAPIGSSPEECATNIRSEIDKWAKVVKASGMRVE